MAAQMLVALAIAFAAGLIFFPAHWPWIVLSAFIVCSGAIGRGDALYKAILRLGGAIGGTLVAAVLSFVDTSNSELYAALVFFVLFVGVWLRQINYAYWAACATLIFALLQNVQGPGAGALFGIRVLCIFIGALCGVLATWFVYPIRTGQIVRRRIGDALIAMRGVLTGEEHDLEHHAAQLDRIAPPLRLHRTFFARDDSGQHPATLVERTRALLTDLRAPDYDRARVGAEMKRLRSSLENKET